MSAVACCHTAIWGFYNQCSLELLRSTTNTSCTSGGGVPVSQYIHTSILESNVFRDCLLSGFLCFATVPYTAQPFSQLCNLQPCTHSLVFEVLLMDLAAFKHPAGKAQLAAATGKAVGLRSKTYWFDVLVLLIRAVFAGSDVFQVLLFKILVQAVPHSPLNKRQRKGFIL